MGRLIKEKLFSHTENKFYDSEGYVNPAKLRAYLGLKAKNIAHIVGRTPRSLEKNPKSNKVQLELRKIVYIHALLKSMTNNESEILLWLRAPNPEYSGLSPIEVISQGKIDSIVNYLENIKKGSPA
ncbi:MAG: hypothetical protein MUP02_07240 [Actinobacteria bacterium]|nr:hypothetical protein [Actinomycetota bacterium]